MPANGLVVAAVVTAGLYLFAQDWLRTLVFADYLGFGYVAYLLLALAFLTDVAFNRARISRQLLDLMFSSIGNPIC